MQNMQTMRSNQQAMETSVQLAVDVGNRSLKYCTSGGSVKYLSSWHKDLEEWDEPIPDKQSVVMRYIDGDNEDLIGSAWAVGLVAQDLGAAPPLNRKSISCTQVGACHSRTLAWCPQYAGESFGVLPPNDLQADKVDAIIDGLMGTHKLERNGEPMTLEIQDVEVQPETLGAFKWARVQKVFQYPDSYINGILDLGGKTGIGQLYTKNGTLIRESRVIVEGTYQLAQMVARHPQLIREDISASLSLIMDAIADGSLVYGTTGIQLCRQVRSST
ncbi:MAG: hypothetical protein HC925_06345 [Coleofasciculaceae cyanobacterium SM2_3_26]|nr:hypothetical protein [Coleofasciculaceae cyanobacterium SM2_3_26]